MEYRMSRLIVNQIQGDATSKQIEIPTGHRLTGGTGSIVPAGSVVQCQNIRVTDRSSQSITQNSANASATNITGMTLNVTPVFANSKMIIQARWCGEFGAVSSGAWNNMFLIQRDGAPVSQPPRLGGLTAGDMPSSLGYYAQDDSSTMENCMWDTVDFPNTTSQITYTAAIYNGFTAYTLYNNRNVNGAENSSYETGSSTIVVWEIAQ
jgi:hypothetical protein